MNVRIMITALIGATIIVGGVLLFENGSAPVGRPSTTQEGTSSVAEPVSPKDTPRAVPAGWQRYDNASLQFTVDYPTGWSYRTEDEAGTTLSFSPPVRAFQEVESNPRIILKLVPLVNVLGVHESAAAWFDVEVKKNPERWDVRADTLAGNPRYAFTEGAGEYPHENIIIMRGATAYWFTIEASDPAMHEALPQIAASLQFRQ